MGRCECLLLRAQPYILYGSSLCIGTYTHHVVQLCKKADQVGIEVQVRVHQVYPTCDMYVHKHPEANRVCVYFCCSISYIFEYPGLCCCQDIVLGSASNRSTYCRPFCDTSR